MTTRMLSFRILLTPVAILLAAAAAAAQIDGAFTLRASGEGDRLQLNLQSAEGRSNYGRTFDRSALTDFTHSGDRSTFALRRPAGTFHFEGRGTADRAAGSYDFVPDAGYRREIEGLGFNDVDERALFVFALDQVSIAEVKKLQELVSDTLDTAQLVRLINHGAGVQHVQAMSDAGFRKLTAGEYRRARDHGVSADFAREMTGFGMKLTLAELIRIRDHGVTAEYVRGMRAAGHGADHVELVRARDHGVSVDYVRRMGALGFNGLPLSEYVRMRDHGVTPEFVESLRDAGVKMTTREAIRLRDHGVSAEYVRRVTQELGSTPTVEQIIRLRTHGVLRR